MKTKKVIRILATFIFAILIGGSFVLWPHIEDYIFGERENTEIFTPDLSKSIYTHHADLISKFSTKKWDKDEYENIELDIQSDLSLSSISKQEYITLKSLLTDAYIKTLQNSMSEWTESGCIDENLSDLEIEIMKLSEESLTYKGYLEEEAKIINTYRKITNDLSSTANKIIRSRYNEKKISDFKKTISNYKNNIHFKKCKKVITIVKSSESKIKDFTFYVDKYNEKIHLYDSNYVRVKKRKCIGDHDCEEYIKMTDGLERKSPRHHDNFIKTIWVEEIDKDEPFAFNWQSGESPLRCDDYQDYTYYYNQLKKMRLCGRKKQKDPIKEEEMEEPGSFNSKHAKPINS